MDGINPTLAFAALFLGLSGHPRDVAERPAQPEHTTNWQYSGPSDRPIGYLFDCPGAAIAVDDENAPIVPQGVDPLEGQKVALTSSVLSLDPDAAEKPTTVSGLSGNLFQDHSGCDEFGHGVK